jgi:2-dehydro-3-deoxygluconokinase
MTRLVSLGEMMLRLAPPGFERLRRASSLDVRPCGAQFNIAANTAVLGMDSVFLTKLPDNELGHLAHALAASYGIDMSHVRREGDKMGLVFVEFSAAPRPLAHIYDRTGSAASTITEDDFDWGAILQGARYAYVDGIFPGLRDGPRRAALAFAGAAKEAGCTLCFDVNYRASLWPPVEALALYREILPAIDILVTNRAVAEDIFGYGGSDGDLLRAHRDEFGCEVVCLTYRHMQGLRRGTWSSTALFGDDVLTGREFAFDVVDRFGTGDAFFAGLLYAYDRDGDPQHALDFGNALCALAHTVEGDVAILSPDEVDALLEEDYSLITKR